MALSSHLTRESVPFSRTNSGVMVDPSYSRDATSCSASSTRTAGCDPSRGMRQAFEWSWPRLPTAMIAFASAVGPMRSSCSPSFCLRSSRQRRPSAASSRYSFRSAYHSLRASTRPFLSSTQSFVNDVPRSIIFPLPVTVSTSNTVASQPESFRWPAKRVPISACCAAADQFKVNRYTAFGLAGRTDIKDAPVTALKLASDCRSMRAGPPLASAAK